MTGEKFIENSEVSEINEFYKGASVFITGAAGFLGSILLETLLRCCPGIHRIYVLLRERKGVQPEERIKSTFDKSIFNTLKKEDPEATKKVIVIRGDVSQPDLGIISTELGVILEDVSVVFHCASCIRFDQPLSYMITENVIGTENVLKLCRKLSKLKSLVYVSTAYSNCNRKTKISEEVTKLPLPPKYFIEAVRCQDQDRLSFLEKSCLPKWPNTYTFSKAIVEHLLIEEANDLPLSIVRPSIVTNTWKGSLPGYVELGGGLHTVIYMTGIGIVKVILMKKEMRADLIPADVVVNTLIISSWCIGTQRMSPLVVNCTSGRLQPVTWGNTHGILQEMLQKHPVPRSFQNSYCSVHKYKLLFYVVSLFQNFLIAFLQDLIRVILGSKPRYVKMHQMFYRKMESFHFFTMNEWEFECDNFITLRMMLNSKDAKVFNINIKNLDWKSAFFQMTENAPYYDWKLDNKSKQERIIIMKRTTILVLLVKGAVIFSLLLFSFAMFGSFISVFE